MADKKTTTKTDSDWAAKAWHMGNRYYLELARLTTGLFIGVMALMTFLLTVGLQHPQKPFEPVFYTTVSLLSLGLIVYVIGHMAQQMVMNLKEAGADEAKLKSAKMMLRTVHGVQQVVFVLSVIAILVMVLVSGHIFFAAPAAQAAPTGQ